MAKKIKPNKLFENDHLDEKDVTSDEKSNIEDAVDLNPVVGTGRISAEDVRKLEQFDAMEKSLAALSEEKSKLEAKVAEYVMQLEEMKSSFNDVPSLRVEIEELKSKCSSLESKNARVPELEASLKNARDENDKYLVKISELSFENASLTSQLAEIEKKMKAGGNVANQSAFSPSNGLGSASGRLSPPNRDAYNPYVNNGYGTW